MSAFKILLVDDDPQSLDSTRRILEHSEYSVDVASSGLVAIERLKQGQGTQQKPDLIVTDVRMPGMNGMEFVEAYQKLGYNIPFVVMTAFGQVQDAVWAMKAGAVDFLLKPFKRQQLLDAVVQIQKLHAAPVVSPAVQVKDFVGSSRKIRELQLLVEQVARTEASVLVLGESGSGKERVARAIHDMSSRASKPFIAINCAAIPENLLESELFGYEKGAFSGAISSKMGLLEAAQGGTLLLDEIGDMPMSLQPKLLRVLEDQKVRRLGAHQERQVDVRIVASTHQNLQDQVRRGQFRQDLFYRLDVMTLAVPPLRDRLEDVPELTQYFLEKYACEHGRAIRQAGREAIRGIDTEAQALLIRHSWPGNIRELSNVLERAVVLNTSGLIQKSDLPMHLQMAAGAEVITASSGEQVTISLGMSLKEIEDLMIQKALAATGGDRGGAAKLLGVNERTIYRRISKKDRTPSAE
ncbi:MAG: sigma-54-dependent Fis family transcriptional regulator [Bdellovibrionales bacterium]|nr:sigma-54-dependent Fis family transcriptional regulator [Bdellovibrionales bacterium]